MRRAPFALWTLWCLTNYQVHMIIALMDTYQKKRSDTFLSVWYVERLLWKKKMAWRYQSVNTCSMRIVYVYTLGRKDRENVRNVGPSIKPSSLYLKPFELIFWLIYNNNSQIMLSISNIAETWLGFGQLVLHFLRGSFQRTQQTADSIFWAVYWLIQLKNWVLFRPSIKQGFVLSRLILKSVPLRRTQRWARRAGRR